MTYRNVAFFLLASLAFGWHACNKDDDKAPADNGIYEASLEILAPAEKQNHLLEFGTPYSVEVHFKTEGDDKAVQRAFVGLQAFGASVFDPKVLLETFIDQNVDKASDFHFKHTYTPARHEQLFIYAYTADTAGIKSDSATVGFWVQEIVSEDFPIAVGLSTTAGAWEGVLEVMDASVLQVVGNYHLHVQNPGLWSFKIELLDKDGKLIQVLHEVTKDGNFSSGGFCCPAVPGLASGSYFLRTTASRMDGTGFNAAVKQLKVL
jgi:hypothetical protein